MENLMNDKNYCQICNEVKFIEIKKNNFFLRTDSSNKKLINFKNVICYNCGTIYHIPKIDEKKLIYHYENDYRNTDSAIYIDDKIFDLPVRFEWTSVSFKRFHAFHEILKDALNKDQFNKIKSVLDYGCYQGAFLYACKKILNLKTIGTDYNSEGLKMAKSFFLIDDVFKTEKNFYERKIKADIIVLLHVFEHLSDPIEFLTKIKKNALADESLIYIEIPNPYSNPLNDPTHLNLFSEETMKYIMKCCNYEIILCQKRSSYRNSSLLRNNNNLNIHILAKSLNNKSVSLSLH